MLKTHQSRQRQSVSKTGHRGFEVTRLEVTVNALSLHRCVHICPNQGNGAPCDSTSLVRDLDGNVLCAFHNDDLDGWEIVLVVDAKSLDYSTQGVLEEFEADVGEMPRYVGEDKVFGADELHRRSFEHRVVLFTHESRVFDGFLDNVVDVLKYST